MTAPPGPDAAPLTGPTGTALVDRDAVLQIVARYLADAWESFDEPRPEEPDADDALLDRLSSSLPEVPGDLNAALGDAVEVLEASVSPARPLFVAWVGSTGLELGVLGTALSAAYDANLATAAGAADLLDQQAARWVADFIGFPMREGHFTSGGQTSNLTALLAAREAALPGSRDEGVGARRAAVYCSDEAHHSIVRSVEVAGLGRSALRRIPLDDRRRMRAADLADAIARDRSAGITPVAVIATAGTTLTGAVDPLDEIATVCEREGVWLHIDGAYGLPAAATASAGPLFAGLDRADSCTIDAHKWLGMQKGCSVILVRRTGALRAAFGHEERYMLQHQDTGNPVDHTLEYSRPFTSLRLWLSMRVHGATRFREWIEQTLRNAAHLTDAVRARDDFELLHEPMLSTVCFRHAPPGLADANLDAHNENLARAMQRDGRVFIAPAVVDGRTCLRACFVNFRTSPDAARLVLDVAAELGTALAAPAADT